ncbi:MAG: FAD-binding protein [Oscillospiraceae bacterium]|nr:FAD-binding protein [Oscillospiraceae bacterium]
MKRICEVTAEGLPTIEEIVQNPSGGCPVCQAARLARKAHAATCGHGTYCRDGLYQLYLIPEDISMGRGSVEDLDLLKDISELIITGNECEMSVRTAELIKASVENHYDEWYDHLTRKRCKAMECPAGFTLYIDPATCTGCGKCIAAAPQGAVAGGDGMIHVIKKDLLELKTGTFEAVCPVGAIKKAGLVKPPVPAEPVPVGSFGAGAGGGRKRRRNAAPRVTETPAAAPVSAKPAEQPKPAVKTEVKAAPVVEAPKAVAPEAPAEKKVMKSSAVVRRHKARNNGGNDNMIQMEADVVVIACGMSGLAAATQAQESLNATGGGKVIAFEKSGTTGGAANMGMAFLAFESQLQKETMTNDFTKDDAFNFFMEYTHWRSDAKTVRRWFNMSASTVEWVQKMGVEFLGVYKYFKDSHATQHMVKVPGTTKPTERCASVMIKKITEYANEIGVEIQFNTAVKEILTGSQGQVRGIIAVDSQGNEIECLCNAVIVATGGMGNNVDMIEQYMGWKWGVDMFTFRIPGIDGDGMNMVWKLGAKKAPVNMEVTYNTPGTTDVFKTLSEVMRQPNLLVNLDGKRFFNEEHMDNTTYTGNSLLQQKRHMGISIIDSRIVDYYKEHGLDYITYHHDIKTMDKWEYEKELYFSGAKSAAENSVFASDDKEVSYGEIEERNFFECQSIEEIAEVTGCNLANLRKTIEEYNAMCNGWGNGYDWQFCKDHRFLKPITTAPFYVAKHFPSGYGSLGGIQVNENMQVLNTELDPIPGLYACGTDAATVFADSYCFYNPGSTMSWALNSGRIAGMESVGYMDSDEFIDPEE